MTCCARSNTYWLMASLSPRVSTLNSAEEGTTLRPVPACHHPDVDPQAPALCGGMAMQGTGAAWASGQQRVAPILRLAAGMSEPRR